MNPVSKVKSEGSAIVSFVKSHPVGALVFGMVFGAFAFGMVAKYLGTLKAKGGLWDKAIPSAFTK